MISIPWASLIIFAAAFIVLFAGLWAMNRQDKKAKAMNRQSFCEAFEKATADLNRKEEKR